MLSPRGWFGLFAAVLASVSIVAVAVWFAAGRGPHGRRGPSAGPGGAAASKIAFAPGVSSGDADLDAFIHRFVAYCVEQDYEQYRLCWTAYAKPINSKQFENVWNLVSRAVIQDIRPVPQDVKVLHPAYVIQVEAHLDAKALAYRRKQQVSELAPEELHRQVEILVQREGDRWAIGLPPHRESAATASAPASEPSLIVQPEGPTPP